MIVTRCSFVQCMDLFSVRIGDVRLKVSCSNEKRPNRFDSAFE
ncbi:hypothetical protein RB3422 [Rhodopirellula baltica SH 1]|uniref:Uncharacterized protein n=1 Tax=Rhodopirellula baltica (strain DSM 10527 / NCIMB 13988 / SH1) TaxID=243090 RepID=Q7UU98_RHOBA|nr:hypothetical protein RB3422 [Rhodopirellula baltica SH 1]